VTLPDGWFFDEDILAYRSLAERIPDGGSIVELGVWKGRSLCSIADIIIRKHLKVFAVDTFLGTVGEEKEHHEAKEIDLRKEFEANTKAFGFDAAVLQMTTDEAAATFGITDRFDLVFIDADHATASVSRDIANWAPKCKGVIAGHDYERESVSTAVNGAFTRSGVKSKGLVWWHDFNEPVIRKKLDVIIPAYKAQGTIERTLASIVMQSALDRITITIVNDADGIGYEKFVEQFKDFADIKEIVLEKNGGPGVARQAGIDATTAPYFTCIDADDTFAGAFACEVLLKAVETNPEYHTIVGSFAEEHENLAFVVHNNDLVWMFGKLYTRAFCEKYKIRFNETRANEDNGFNTAIRLVSSETEKIMFLPDIVYYWHWKENSITRINNAQYSYDQSFCGYTDNMIYAVQLAKQSKPMNPYIEQWAIQVMAQLYNYYYQTVKRDPRFTEQNYGYCKKYYKEIFKEMYETHPREYFADIFAQTLSEQAPNMKDNVPDKTIYQFIEGLA
jgi:glycosyltransferase involved in cell wall biosynthesis